MHEPRRLSLDEQTILIEELVAAAHPGSGEMVKSIARHTREPKLLAWVAGAQPVEAARNPCSPPSLLAELFARAENGCNGAWQIKFFLTGNHNTPSTILQYLAENDTTNLAKHAAAEPLRREDRTKDLAEEISQHNYAAGVWEGGE